MNAIRKSANKKYVEIWEVQSESNPDKTYTVAMDGAGAWSCGCPRWTRNKTRPMCKHIRHVQNLTLGVLPARQTKPKPRKKSEFSLIEL